MNILPKKSWHVRNKDNVARVRRDEAKALEEEQECSRRRALAEQEARIALLRRKAVQKQADEKQKFTEQFEFPQEPDLEPDNDAEAKQELEEYKSLNTAFSSSKHINLFEDFEEKKKKQGSNREYEDEKRRAQEAYERKVGYLTYLGKGAADSEESKPWYDRPRAKEAATTSRSCVQEDLIRRSDPLIAMHKYLDKGKHKEGSERRSTRVSVTTLSKPELEPETDKTSQLNFVNNPATFNGGNLKPHEEQSKKRKHKKSKHKKHKRSKDHHSAEEDAPITKKDNLASSSASGKTLAVLRAERLERERAEREKSIKLISRVSGEIQTSSQSNVIDERKLDYNTTYSNKIRSRHY